MTGSVNKAIVIGHCGKDPEIRTTQSGTKVASLSIATSESWRDKSTGERKQDTQWHRVVCFNDGLVKVIEQYVKKGSALYIEGAMKTRSWRGQDNVERYVTEIVLGPFNAKLVLLDRREGAPQADGPDAYGGAAAAPDINDEIPF